MTANLTDHVLVSILVLGLPALAMRDYRQLRRALQRGHDRARARAYWKVHVEQWGLVLVLALHWWMQSRPWSELGLGPGAVAPWRVLVGSAVVVAAVAFLLVQQRQVSEVAETREALREQMESLKEMLPHSPGELRLFRSVSVTAGICEELLYRGFLLAYLGLFVSAWIAVPVAALVFGLAHAYQGGWGILKTGAIGLVMALLYLLTGSLLQPVILHVAIDWINGEMAYEVIARDGEAAAES